ncbi:NUDIX domain-containing protein [Amycolatopsis rhizosphaerae]|uniref:NUDIX domain-containing protein n=1 Tax=Amycolatopsis rhizosphaerae TaxID=2053003 RepID=A0A558CH45_9PSEU|nr:NUDIX domain-containing protein [Amycolatopsis rhizosphaerae]TVT48100.1 NUDIX domain-containing protein [Amycolatopsis rhizosphaerae]
MPKRDYYDDPNAPRANSLVPAVSAVVLDEQGRILMIRRTDNDLYAIPGGAQDIGETVKEAVIRETREETGIDIEVTGLVGIYSDPKHVIAYDDGEVRQEFSICFRGRPLSGRLQTSSESKEVLWVELKRIDSMNINDSIRLRILQGISECEYPFYM